MKTLHNLVGLIVILAMAFTSCESNSQNQTTNNQPKQEKVETGQGESPEKEAAREAAYQFVMNIVNENYAEAVELMTLEFFPIYARSLW